MPKDIYSCITCLYCRKPFIPPEWKKEPRHIWNRFNTCNECLYTLNKGICSENFHTKRTHLSPGPKTISTK